MKTEEIFSNLPKITTERLLLRKITMEDLDDMYAYASNDEVSKYVTWETHRNITDTKDFIEYVINRYENNQIAPWGIEHKETKKMIGSIDFVHWLPNHKVAEIGYVLSQEYWGKALMTEAAKALITFGFEKMDVIRIEARCVTDNLRSERVMQKVGMSFEGILRKSMFTKGVHRDMKIYSILKEEFLTSNLYKNYK